jgi:hypothetical protein
MSKVFPYRMHVNLGAYLPPAKNLREELGCSPQRQTLRRTPQTPFAPELTYTLYIRFP